MARFMAGDPIIPDFEGRLARFRERRDAGATKTTVRVVVEPLTDYTRIELYTYPIIAAGGEDVRVLPTSEDTWPDGIPPYDYFLFDERDVWRMHYYDDHTFRGAELLHGADVVADHIRSRDVALDAAIPLLDYRGAEMIDV